MIKQQLKREGGIVGALICCMLVSSCATTPVFRNGKVLLPVIISADAAVEERAAADELGRVLSEMSGLTWPVRAPVQAGERGFHLGSDSTGARGFQPLRVSNDIISPKTGEYGPDGFRIRSLAGSVYIEGATPEATGFAVAWLLQHEGGVRWYAPGETGEKIPRRTRWSLRKLNESREPAYVSREITGLNTPPEQVWARHNGLRGRLEFSHALDRVFPPERLASRPDWAPVLDGQRYLPTAETDHHWQPNLAMPEVAEYSAQAAATAFALDPMRLSFSLGINDTVRFDQSAATRALVEPLRYFRGLPDYSPLVFTFMNRAAEVLARSQPDRYLGCLAYFWCENAPSFPVHRQVLPFVTTDRSQYYDSAYRDADLDLMARWGASGVKAFGLWEYAYGQGFLIPRMPLAPLAESVRAGWLRGARGYLAEVGPQWGFDPFKVWMLAQLLWEPNRSVEDLADDFYPGYYAMAATSMRRFFERCETQWMTQRGPPYWLKLYQQEDQAGLFPAETCMELRGWLNEAARAAGTDPVIATRVARTSRAFAVTEACVKFDGIRSSLAAMRPETALAKEEVLAGLIRNLVEAESTLRRNIIAASEGELPAMTAFDPAAFVRNDPVPRLLWLAGQQDPSAPRRVLGLAGPDAINRVQWRVLADVMAAGKLRVAANLASNSSLVKSAPHSQEPRFLYPHSGPLPAGWELRAMPTETGQTALVGTAAGDSARALRMQGAWDSQLYQWISVEPDCVYVATARLRGQSSPGGDAGLFLTFVDASGKVVGSAKMNSLPKGVTPDWRTSVLADQAPEEAAWVGIGIGASRQVAGDWLEATAVELHGMVDDWKS